MQGAQSTPWYDCRAHRWAFLKPFRPAGTWNSNDSANQLLHQLSGWMFSGKLCRWRSRMWSSWAVVATSVIAHPVGCDAKFSEKIKLEMMWNWVSSSGDDSCSPVALNIPQNICGVADKTINFFMIESVTLSSQFFLFMYVFCLFMYFVGWPIFCLRHPPERPSDAGRHPQAPERGEEDRCVGHAQTAVSTTCRLGVYVCVRVCACVFTRVIGSYYLNRLAELKTRLLFHSQRNWYDCLFWCCYIIHGANIVSSVQRV